ncbi:hypothetical protein U1Q18_052343 [Sarracenia purpurea var. burkii]
MGVCGADEQHVVRGSYEKRKKETDDVKTTKLQDGCTVKFQRIRNVLRKMRRYFVDSDVRVGADDDRRVIVVVTIFSGVTDGYIRDVSFFYGSGQGESFQEYADVRLKVHGDRNCDVLK